jgi:hypothetical protein
MLINIVMCPLKARLVEPEEMVVTREQLSKHNSMATKSCDCSNKYTCNNKGTAEGSVFCAIRAKGEVIEPTVVKV